MFKDILVGQYVPGKSPIHKLNPMLKIILVIFYISALFYIDKPISYAIFTVYTVFLIFISKIPFKMILRGVKPMLWIFIITAVLNLFMTPGDTAVSIPVFGLNITITNEGIKSSIKIIVRLLYLVMGTSLLTLTTSPLQLTDGIEKLLKPLKIIKVPSHEIAMMMTIAIRFIPTLSEETDKIIKAQTARGADFETGNIMKRAKAMIPLIVPLFVSVFRRADDLATAMDARCYNGGKNRTKMKESKINALDIKIAAIFVTAVAILIMAELFIEI